MSQKLEEIRIFLVKLDLKPDRIPTYAEYKKKYREKLFMHPDKAGSEHEEAFKEITEAANKVHEWIIENPELQKTSTEEFKRVAKCFDKDNEVEYNKNNVVIHLDDKRCEAWMEALTRRFGASIPLEDQVGVQFKTSHLKVPKTTESFGSFSASVWSNPKKGTPKILLQGKSYMTFVTFILPEILKEIEAKNDNQKHAIESIVTEPDINTKITEDSRVAIGGSDMETLLIGFQKMESEVIKLRDNLVGIVDQSLHQVKDNTEQFEKKIEKLEKIALENKTELEILGKKIDEVLAHQLKIKPVDVDALEDFINSGKTTFTKLENITSIHADTGDAGEARNEKAQDNAITEVLHDSQNIFAKLDEVTSATVDIKDDIKSDSIAMKEAVVKMSKDISSLVEHLEGTKAKVEPSVRPKEQRKTEVKDDKEDNDDDREPEIEIIEPKRRKGIFFSSSIGLQCDAQKLSNDINSKIRIEKTYHIEKHEDAKDPDMFLRKTVDILDETKDANFIIISVGSNDITRLDIKDDISELNEKACEQSKLLVHIAEEASKKHNIDVFIVEKPARFDKEAKDPEGIRSVLTVSSNGILPSLITPLKRVHLIPLPSLSTSADRDCFSRDGVHLTSKGEHLFHQDLVTGVKSVYSDLNLETFKSPSRKKFQKDGKVEDKQFSNPRSTRGQSGGNTNWDGYHKDWREPRHTGSYNRKYQNHTPEQHYRRYREPQYQYRQPDDRRQYRGPSQGRYYQEHYRHNSDYSQHRHREQEQRGGEQYYPRSYESYQRYY